MRSSGFGRTACLGSLVCLLSLYAAPGAWAQADPAEVARKLNNPIASLISLPMQLNYDTALGPDGEGDRFLMDVQPVIPIGISENWNLISRTIVPLVQLNRRTAGPAARSPTMSGRLPAATTAPTSMPPSCSPSSATPCPR